MAFSKWRERICEADQQAKQVRDDDPLVSQVADEPADARPVLNPVTKILYSAIRSRQSKFCSVCA